MKTIEKVSIAGIAFLLDPEAFAILEAYLSRLHALYAKDPDGVEIIADIEARIAEIILSKQEPDAVVGQSLAGEIVARLGMPEDEGAAAGSPGQTFPRRLYRNPEGAKLGGVCSGLATFFGIDAVWVRLAMFAPLILLIVTSPLPLIPLHGLLGTMIGATALAYLILWAVVPAARTPRQKLEMRGERITASTIEEGFRRDFPVHDNRPGRSQKNADLWAGILYAVGRLALLIIKITAIIVVAGLVLAVVGVATLAGIILFHIGKPGQWFDAIHLNDLLPKLIGVTPEAYVVVSLLVVLIPVAIALVALVRFVAGENRGWRLPAIMGGIWVIITSYWLVVTAINYFTFETHVSELPASFIDIETQQRHHPDKILPDTAFQAMPDTLNNI